MLLGGPAWEPCSELLPDLKVFALEFTKIQLVFVVIAADEEAIKYSIENCLKKIYVIADPRELIFDAFEARVTPFAFLIDTNGKIRSKGLLNHQAHIELLLKPELSDCRRSSAPIPWALRVLSILDRPAGYACGLRNPPHSKIWALLTAENGSTQVKKAGHTDLIPDGMSKHYTYSHLSRGKGREVDTLL